MTAWEKSAARRAIWFLLPALGMLAVFVAWPLIRAAWWSLTDADLLATQDAHWVGAENYSDLLRDPRFRHAFLNTALFAILIVPLQTMLALVLALWVNRPEPAWRWLRTVFFLPVVVSLPVLAVVWTLLYQPEQAGETGLINRLTSVLGFEDRAWLRDPSLALPSLAAMSVWQGAGLQMMVFLAGLQGVSREQIEAAQLDGATAWQRLVYVVIPSLRNTIVFVVTVTTILAFRLFVQPYLMTRGGPDDRTLSLVQYIYETTFLNLELGRACAAALLFLTWVGFLTWLQRTIFKEEKS